MQNETNMSHVFGENCSGSDLYTLTAWFSSLFIFKVWVGPRLSVMQQPKTGVCHLSVEHSRLHTRKHTYTHTHTDTLSVRPL